MKFPEVIRMFDPGRWAMLAGAAALLILIVFVMGKCSGSARKETDLAEAVGKALDHVATETPAIRQDQKEKQDEVDEIPGADQRLPDGFGARLETVAVSVINLLQRWWVTLLVLGSILGLSLIPDSLRAPCENTVDVSGAQTVGDLGQAIVQGDADLRVCNVKKEAIVSIVDSQNRPWYRRLLPG